MPAEEVLQKGSMPALFWLLANGLVSPGGYLDTAFALVRRPLRRENDLIAHWSRLYRKLTGAGCCHGIVTSTSMVLAAAASLAGHD
jgi:hypothetical protein